MWFSEIASNSLKFDHIMINFMPSWWYKNYGIAYGRDMVFDADYRLNAYLAMRYFFYQRYGKFIGAGTNNPSPVMILPDWQNTVTQAFLGFEINYPADGYPNCVKVIKEEDIDKLIVPDSLWDKIPYCEIMQQTKYLNNKFKLNGIPKIPTRGVLNDGMSIRGSEIFSDILDEETDFASKILNYSYKMLSKQITENAKTGNKEFMMMNCTSELIGAAHYQNHVFSYDYKISELCENNGINFSLHHCGCFDRFNDIYSNLKSVRLLDIGHTTRELRDVFVRFPNAKVQYIVDTNLLNNGTVSQVKDKMQELLEETNGYYDRLSLDLIDIEYNTPDDNLFALIETIKR